MNAASRSQTSAVAKMAYESPATTTHASAVTTSARSARKRTTSPDPANAAISASAVDTVRGTSRIGSPRMSVSSTLAWISTPDMPTPPLNTVGKTSCSAWVVEPIRTILPVSSPGNASGVTSPLTIR